MPPVTVRNVAALGLLVLIGCRDSTRTAAQPTASDSARGEVDSAAFAGPSGDTTQSATQPADQEIAGGETSEFSGGDVPLGYCPVIVSRTPLDLMRADVASWTALAQGHHESELEWLRASPSGAEPEVTGRTRVTIDVTVLTAEDVVCSLGGAGGGYETQGIEGTRLRRFALEVHLSTADQAVSASFQGLFFPLRDISFVGQRLLSGFAKLSPESASTGLSLGVDAGARTTPQSLNIDITFDGLSARGTVQLLASTAEVAVTGSFPPSDAER